jgi:spermidine/putrescine-binding protein
VGKTVVSGDAVLAMCDAYDAASAMAADPKVAWVDPSEGQVGYLEGFVVLDGPRNDLARAFVNFFEEQAQYAAFINAVSSPYVQADNTAISQALRDNPVINPPAAVVDKVVYHQFLGEAQAAWDTAWDAFKSA